MTVEGLASLECFYSQAEILSFVNELGRLSRSYKQINVLCSQHLSKIVVASLERQSTCIINLTKQLGSAKWHCIMIVRRFTGFSNEQDYVVELAEGQLKVAK